MERVVGRSTSFVLGDIMASVAPQRSLGSSCCMSDCSLRIGFVQDQVWGESAFADCKVHMLFDVSNVLVRGAIRTHRHAGAVAGQALAVEERRDMGAEQSSGRSRGSFSIFTQVLTPPF